MRFGQFRRERCAPPCGSGCSYTSDDTNRRFKNLPGQRIGARAFFQSVARRLEERERKLVLGKRSSEMMPSIQVDDTKRSIFGEDFARERLERTARCEFGQETLELPTQISSLSRV